MRIHLEMQEKLHIQDMIRQEKIELVTSYILDFENSYNRSIHAYHVPCAVIAECNYFVTTDDRLLKYQSEKIELVTPGEFIRRMEADR